NFPRRSYSEAIGWKRIEKCCAMPPPAVKSAGKETGKRCIRERGDDATHAVYSIGKCLGVLQELLRGFLEEGKITVIVIEL
ncbi:hypothetical protein ACXWOO_11320, partial [Streptococcus pyogenes]